MMRVRSTSSGKHSSVAVVPDQATHAGYKSMHAACGAVAQHVEQEAQQRRRGA
jgi:hypothetical protein